MRSVKSEQDIAEIRTTISAAEAAMTVVLDYIKTDKAPACERAHELIDEVLVQHNCEAANQPEDHVVAYGVASHEPHERGTGPIMPGQPIVVDIFPRHKETSWWADMTRTVCLGDPPQELQDMYRAVETVLSDTADRLRSGVSCDELQRLAEEQFVAMGYQTSGVGTLFKYAEGFVHSLGHGVGKDIHQEPFFGRERGYMLEVGDVITIEPGLYYKHIGGVRLEDMYLITELGSERLTTVPLQLQI